MPDYIASAEQASVEDLRQLGYRASDVERALAATRAALAEYHAQGRIVGEAVPNALRGIVGSGIPQEDEPLIPRAAAVINPAEGYGGQQALRFVAPFTLILVVFFGGMYISDQRRGGYRVERLETVAAAQSPGQSAG